MTNQSSLEAVISGYVVKGEEFKYIKYLCKYYKFTFDSVVNYALDEFNYYKKNGLDVQGCKIMSLLSTVNKCIEENNKR